jgi:hypothetical protein
LLKILGERAVKDRQDPTLVEADLAVS